MSTTLDRTSRIGEDRVSTPEQGRSAPWPFLDRVSGVLVAVAGFVLYGRTAAPSVATIFDDSLEFQVVLPSLGIAHPSGYPFYTLLGKLFTEVLPFRDPAGRANLLSATAAALAVGMLFVVARKIAGSRLAAVIAAAALALSPAWWSQATIAEVYALHGLLVTLFIYLLLRWEESSLASRNLRGAYAPGPGIFQPSPARRPDVWLAVAALVFGLGLAHHRMIALLLPAALVFVIWTEPALIRQPRRWLAPCLCGLAPLLLYFYLPVRGQVITSLDSTYQPTLKGTLDWVLARGYSVFLTGNPFGVARGLTDYLALLLDQMGALLLLAALLGVVGAWRYSARRATFLGLATLAQLLFAVSYKVQDVAVFFLPAFIFMALWAAWGLAPRFDAVARQAAHAASPLRLPAWLRPIYMAAWLLPVAFIVLFEPVRDAIRSFPQQDRSRSWQVYDYGRDAVTSIAAGGRVVGLLGETTLIRYFRDVLGQRADAEVVAADAETARLAAVEAALAAGRPVYLTRDLPGAAARYSLDSAGPLIAVSAKAEPGRGSGGEPFGAGVTLVSSRVEVRRTCGGPSVRTTVTWMASVPIREELKVSARLLDGAGEVVAALDTVPVHYAYPTTAWVPGEPVDDVYDLPLPEGSDPGAYSLLLILYRAADGSEIGRTPPVPVTIAE